MDCQLGDYGTYEPSEESAGSPRAATLNQACVVTTCWWATGCRATRGVLERRREMVMAPRCLPIYVVPTNGEILESWLARDSARLDLSDGDLLRTIETFGEDVSLLRSGLSVYLIRAECAAIAAATRVDPALIEMTVIPLQHHGLASAQHVWRCRAVGGSCVGAFLGCSRAMSTSASWSIVVQSVGSRIGSTRVGCHTRRSRMCVAVRCDARPPRCTMGQVRGRSRGCRVAGVGRRSSIAGSARPALETFG